MGSVQSVDRAFAVLRALAGGPAGVTEIADRCQLPKSTVSRLLATLHELGAVEQAAGGSEYRIGDAIVELAAGAGGRVDLASVARPFLIQLGEQLGEATGLSVLDGSDVHYLVQVDGPHAVQVRDWTGERVPAHLVPSGLVLLACADDTVREAVLSGPLEATTARSVTDRNALRLRLRRISPHGVEWVQEEFADGITSVAAVVHDSAGAAVAAVHAHGPTFRFPGNRSPAEIAGLVRATATKISERL